jgi:hypothetical protein
MGATDGENAAWVPVYYCFRPKSWLIHFIDLGCLPGLRQPHRLSRSTGKKQQISKLLEDPFWLLAVYSPALTTGHRHVLQKNTNQYSSGIDLTVRHHWGASLFGLGFWRIRASIFEIFDTQD